MCVCTHLHANIKRVRVRKEREERGGIDLES